MKDRDTERREWRRVVDDVIHDLELEAERQAPKREQEPGPLSPWVVDCGPGTTPADRRAIQAYENEITRLDRRDRGW